MKALFHFTAPLLALITMIACTELEVSENPQNSNNELLQELSVTGKDFIFDGETRSTVTIGENGASFTWDEDDVIGIFPDKGDQVSFAMDEGAGTQTATFSGGGWALKSSAKYAAYYPHVYENRDLTAIPVSYVGQTQNGNGNTDHIGAYDFMAAGVSTPENGAVAFDMQHLGALVQLSITVPEPSTVTKVVLTSSTEFTETGTIDLTADTPAITAVTQSNTLEIALNNVTTTEANEKVIVYFMMAPVDLTDSELTATIHFDDEIIHEVEISGKNLKGGKAYKLAEKAEKTIDYIDEYGINQGKGIELDGIVWAPVNCGYHKDDFKYGKLYQWGRKYGQGWYTTDNDYSEYNTDLIKPNRVAGPVSLDIGQSESAANNFYYNYTSPDDWLSPRNDNLWWDTESNLTPTKTEYDPCPSGWRVPSYTELATLGKYHLRKTNNELGQSGVLFGKTNTETLEEIQIFLPFAGKLLSNNGDGDVRNGWGCYWSSEPSYEKAFALNLRDADAVMFDYARATGYSVRCVHE